MSPGEGPSTASTIATMTSASSMAVRAWSWTLSDSSVSGSRSRPPMSTRTNGRPAHVVSAITRSRVVPATSETMAFAPSRQPVEQGRFADVGPADYGYDRSVGHSFPARVSAAPYTISSLLSL